MFTFNGKINWDSFAVNETITIVFPSPTLAATPGNCVYIFFQWSKEPITGVTEVAACFSGTIASCAKDTLGTITIVVTFASSTAKYSFTATIGATYTNLSLTMRRDGDLATCGTGTLISALIDTAATSLVRLYTGTFTWQPFANNQLVTILVPYGVVDGVFVGLFHQWTKSPVPLPPLVPDVKVNDALIGTFASLTKGDDDSIVASCVCAQTGFKCTFKFDANLKGGFFTLCVGEAPELKSPEFRFSLKF